MKVREFLETLALNNYFAISINELVDSKEYSSGELSIVVYDTKNIINMLSDTILNKTFSHAHIAFNRLIKHITRLEMITRCLQGTDTSILGDPDMDDSLDELCNNMIFKLPCDKNEYCKMFEEPKEVKHYDED